MSVVLKSPSQIKGYYFQDIMGKNSLKVWKIRVYLSTRILKLPTSMFSKLMAEVKGQNTSINI